jgi:hypothetical protein
MNDFASPGFIVLGRVGGKSWSWAACDNAEERLREKGYFTPFVMQSLIIVAIGRPPDRDVTGVRPQWRSKVTYLRT